MVLLIRISDCLKVHSYDMIYFDAKHSNIVDVENIGVVSYLVTNGITTKDLMHGFFKYSDTYSGSTGSKVYQRP